MKKTSTLTIILLMVICLFGQDEMPDDPDFQKVDLFSNSWEPASKSYASNVTEGAVFEFDKQKAEIFLQNNLQNFSLVLNTGNNGKTLKLNMTRSKIFAPDFMVYTSDNGKTLFDYNGGLHYHGYVNGEENSLAAISVFDNEVMGLISTVEGNYNLGKLSNSDNAHILYLDKNMIDPPSFECFTEDDGIGYTPEQLTTSSKTAGECTRIYLEGDQTLYNNLGSAAAVTNLLTGVFNQSAVLYLNDGLNVVISEIFVWTTPDPYSGPTAQDYRIQFQANTGAFNGDLGALIALDNVGGQAAGFSGICNAVTDESLCFAGFSGTGFSIVPIYSFNVYIMTHELGHLFGSRHTHACVWNGNNTAIDGCAGYTEGTCPLPGNPSGGGTIMSYCNNTSVGVNFTLGFGPQPGAVIFNSISNATCLFPCATNEWTGATNAYWHNDGNWTLGHIPFAGENVVITSAGSQPVRVDFYDEECEDLLVESGATLNIYDQKLVINGNMTINGELGMIDQTAGNSEVDVMGDVFWNSGSTENISVYNAFINVYGDWTFNSGANFNPSTGFVDFKGTTSNWIRGYSSNCNFYNMRNYKSGGSVARFSNLCTEDIVITNLLYQPSTGTIWSSSDQDIIINGNFNNYGAFDFTQSSNTGSAIFNGSAQNINNYTTGSGIFNNIIFSSTTSTTLLSDALTVMGDLTIESGTFNSSGLPVEVHGSWNNTGGTYAANGSAVTFNGNGFSFPQDVNGSNTFYDVVQLNTGSYLRFNGPTTITNNLDIQNKCWTYTTFNVNGTLSINDAASQFTANGSSANATIVNLDQGGKVLCNGAATITINDLAESYIIGTYEANTAGGVINISNGGAAVDLGGDLIISGGTINISGNFCYWPWNHDASVTMSAGVLDIMGCDIYINNSPTYSLTDNITGGTIRTDHGFSGNRADFTPSAGTFEFYGGITEYISQTNGCTLPYVVIDKLAPSKISSFPAIQKVDDGRIDKYVSDSKAPDIFLSSNFVVTNYLIVNSGSLTLSGYSLTVANDIDVYGTLNMTNAADILNVGTGAYDNLAFGNGSFGNLTSGVANLASWIWIQSGGLVTASTSNTINFNGPSVAGIEVDDAGSTFGNINVISSSPFRLYTEGGVQIEVDGNFDLQAGNTMDFQDRSMIVHGVFTDDPTSIIYIQDGPVAKSSGNSSAYNESNSQDSELSADGTNKSGTKGGAFEMDNNFTLNGLMDVGDGDVLMHGGFSIATTGTLNIDGGTVIDDAPLGTDIWHYINGSINMTSGLFEISNNSLNFGALSVNSISGGTIRTGAFYAGNAGTFLPTGGTVETIGTFGDNNLFCSNGNYFYNFVVNRQPGVSANLQTVIDVHNDLTINSGILNTNSFNINIGGNWTNNVGSTGFNEGTGTVIFDGSIFADIITSETFYNLSVAKTAPGFDALEMADGITVNVNNELNILDGTLEMNNNSTLNVANNVQINLNAGLNAGGLDTGLELFIGGNWTNNNTGYNTIYGYTPGYEIITFNGPAHQYITTNAPQEDFGNLVINKPGVDFMSNNSIRVIGDLDIIAGGWHDNVPSLTHYFEGDFYVTAGTTAHWYSQNGNTVVFKGVSDQTVYNPIGYHYFYDIIVDKTAWPAKDSGAEEGEGLITIPTYEPSKDGKALTVTLTSSIDMQFGNGLTIEEGTLDLNGNLLNSMGYVNVNDGGTLIVDEGAILKIKENDNLSVNDGGTLEIIGISSDMARISHRASGYYFFNVYLGGTISASYGLFEYTTVNGLWVRNGAIVDPINSFNNCTFQNGFPGFATMLQINNADDVSITGASFPDVASSDFNVAKTLDQGNIYMIDATGPFSGEDFDYGFDDRIVWTYTTRTLDLTVFLEGPFNSSTNKMDLGLNSILPLNQPFDTPPLSNPSPDWYYTGSESVGSIPNPFIVDWVLVELRDATSAATALPGTAIYTQAAFVTNTGNIVDLDGVSPLTFTGSITNNLYAVVWTRNHLGIISANPLVDAGGIYTYDFSSGSGQAEGGTSAQHQLSTSPAIWGVIPGDANATGLVAIGDKTNVWWLQAGITGYLESDYNFDGEADNIDKNDYWLPNMGDSSFIP